MGEIDWIIEVKVIEYGIKFVIIGYKGYQYVSCIFVNYVVCYGISGDKKFKDGDILNIDVIVIVDGWFGDFSCMYVVGKLLCKVEWLI